MESPLSVHGAIGGEGDNGTGSGLGGNLYGGSGGGGANFNLNGTINSRNVSFGFNTASTDGGAIYSLGDYGIATQDGPTLLLSPANVNVFNTVLA